MSLEETRVVEAIGLGTVGNAWPSGTVVGEKYRILGWIGAGAMAAVYRAEHIHFAEARALKVINPELAGNQSFVRRFMQEAVLTRRLRHPNAVRVDDIDKAADGRPFIVMEYVEGRALQDVMREQGPMAAARVCAIVKQLAAALEAAHALGIVHRDVKPSNIILRNTSQGERAVVLDFGIAKAREAQLGESGPEHVTMTGVGLLIGTPAYMSPEQATGKRGDELDGRSDLYSLGVVMYQMLTGELPLKADSELQLLLAHVSETPVPLQTRRPDIPRLIADLAMKCLEKDPHQRPKDARAVIDAIESWERDVASEAVRTSAFDLTRPNITSRQFPEKSPRMRHSSEDLYKTIFGDRAVLDKPALHEPALGAPVTKRRSSAPRAGYFLILLVVVSLGALTGALLVQRHGFSLLRRQMAGTAPPIKAAASVEPATIAPPPDPIEKPADGIPQTPAVPPQSDSKVGESRPTQTPLPVARTEAQLLKMVPPVYPRLAVQARVQGNVEFVATISQNGNVRELRLVSGHPLLVKAAADAVLQWKYAPAVKNGEPHETATNIVVKFVLKPKQAS